MDKFSLIRLFSNGERFVKRQQEFRGDSTVFTFDMKRPDRKLRKKSFSFVCKRRVDEIGYVKFFIEDTRHNFLAARIYDEDYLQECINS